MAGLYWVDRTAQAGRSYAYRVTGTWSSSALRVDGYAVGIGAEAGSLPSLGPARASRATCTGTPLAEPRPALARRPALGGTRHEHHRSRGPARGLRHRPHGWLPHRALTEKAVALVPGSTFVKRASCFTDDSAPPAAPVQRPADRRVWTGRRARGLRGGPRQRPRGAATAGEGDHADRAGRVALAHRRRPRAG